MALGQAVAAPRGYVEFCARKPSECGLGGDDRVDASTRAQTLYSQYYWRAAFNLPAAPSMALEVMPDPLATSPRLLATLEEVNDRINRAIRFTRERKSPVDSWDMPLARGSTSGDCEDYVLEKRRALVGAGVQPEALSIAVVQTPRGEGHAVLLVNVAGGELVLDNLSSQIVPWSETRYRWISRQAPGQPMSWVQVGV